MEVEEIVDLLKMHVGLVGFEVVDIHHLLMLVFALKVEVAVSLYQLPNMQSPELKCNSSHWNKSLPAGTTLQSHRLG